MFVALIVQGLRMLNAVGYRQPGSGLVMDLVYNNKQDSTLQCLKLSITFRNLQGLNMLNAVGSCSQAVGWC
jgi:hypothetical protein